MTKDPSDPDVDTVLVHADEFMAMIGALLPIMGDGWDHPSCSRQEIFDLFMYHFGWHEE